MKRTTVLVTGATGFAGSHALQALAAREDVRLIAHCRNPARLPAGYKGEVRTADLCDPTALPALLEGVEVVCHAAAWSALWGHARESEALYLRPSLALLEAARAAGVKRFLFVSTASAAAPERSADALNPGTPRPFWPHLVNLLRIEEALRAAAGPEFTAVVLRFGLFVGERYSLGLLPILVPRLRTRLVPWVAGGRTSMPLIDGRDIGQALSLAATAPGLGGYEAFNVVGPEAPTVREVLLFLHETYGLPRPRFSVPFAAAYAFAWLMERLNPLLPGDPLIVRSIVHLLEEVGVDNERARTRLGYRPQINWREAIRSQMAEMAQRETAPMAMHRPLPADPGG